MAINVNFGSDEKICNSGYQMAAEDNVVEFENISGSNFEGFKIRNVIRRYGSIVKKLEVKS